MCKALPASEEMPVLASERLTMRPFQPTDAAEVQRLAGDRSVADTTLNVPHPYLDGMAEQWINSHAAAFAAGTELTLAITDRSSGVLVGATGLRIQRAYNSAELGYWVGSEFRNRGYCTEAARELLAHAFERLQLNRIHASHLKRNPASGKVMLKLGMRREGERPQHVKKWDRYEDLVLYGLLREDWNRAGPNRPVADNRF
jgi:RimJ/RimL family protein N-acetyltransferase